MTIHLIPKPYHGLQQVAENPLQQQQPFLLSFVLVFVLARDRWASDVALE
jgi:hypothetical protein